MTIYQSNATTNNNSAGLSKYGCDYHSVVMESILNNSINSFEEYIMHAPFTTLYNVIRETIENPKYNNFNIKLFDQIRDFLSFDKMIFLTLKSIPNIDMLTYLLSIFDLNNKKVQICVKSCLLFSISYGYSSVYNQLLNTISVDWYDTEDMNDLAITCSKFGYLDGLIKLQGSSYNYNRAFVIACGYGHLNIVKYYIDKYDIDLSYNKCNPMRIAIIHNRIKIVEFLANLDAPFRKRDIQLAKAYRHNEIIHILSKKIY